MLAANKVKMSGSEKNKNRAGTQARTFLVNDKKSCVTWKLHVLVVQNGIVVVHNKGKKVQKKCAARANLFIC